jgi:LPPG:FO 2-phospho-L-lactate transferase
MITVLTGGTGGAKFVDGLRRILPAEELTLIVNTGDDFEWWGLHISPDVDSIAYVLCDLLSKERGWGVQDDTFLCLDRMKKMGEPAWFQIGDRDLATHLLRTQLLQQGKTLAEATAKIAAKLGIAAKILPMSNDQVETIVETRAGELSFQEYFVQRHYQDEVRSVRFRGGETSKPAPGVVEAILAAKAILLAPSNPITSIGPILAVPGIRAALHQTEAPVVAISPIVGGTAVTGPAGALMAACGLPVSVAGVAKAYEDFLDILIADNSDIQEVEDVKRSGLKVCCTNAIMKTEHDRMNLAKAALGYVSSDTERAKRTDSVASLAGGTIHWRGHLL